MGTLLRPTIFSDYLEQEIFVNKTTAGCDVVPTIFYEAVYPLHVNRDILFRIEKLFPERMKTLNLIQKVYAPFYCDRHVADARNPPTARLGLSFQYHHSSF